MTLHVLMASHNRRDVTVRCLRSLGRAVESCGLSMRLTLFDDGSSDGTSEAVRDLLPTSTVLRGDGSTYWAGAMHKSEQSAIRRLTEGDFLLWLNDDVELDQDALIEVLTVAKLKPGRVVVGAFRDPISNATTYAGFTRSGWHPLKFRPVVPSHTFQEVDAFNGNLVLVPYEVYLRRGGIDGRFSHALADIDYGMRLSKAGEPALLAPNTVGLCARNPPRARGTLRHDWNEFLGPKGGGNLRSLSYYLTRHSPRRRLVSIAYTYAGWWAREIAARITLRTTRA